jgi:peptidoglycan/xylan/chitin deacetylase (PgdA/CDA1 family)
VRVLKTAIKQICNALQVNETLVSRHRSDLLVLNYHGVLAEARADGRSYGNCVDAQCFRLQLRWLKRHFSPQGLDGLRSWQAGLWIIRKPPVLITFDDGYRNNLTVAAPICREEGVPAIFFLSAGMIGAGKILWNTEIVARVRHWLAPQIAMPNGERQALPRDTASRRSLADKINRESKQLPEEALCQYLAYLREGSPSVDLMEDPEACMFLSWDEARELVALGFEIGSHTVSHPILSRLTPARVRAELRDSKAILERELKQPCRALAYPNGSERDVNQVVVDEAQSAGYEWAFMTTPWWHKPGGAAVHSIPRIGVPGHTDMSTFKFYVSGLHSRLSGIA